MIPLSQGTEIRSGNGIYSIPMSVRAVCGTSHPHILDGMPLDDTQFLGPLDIENLFCVVCKALESEFLLLHPFPPASEEVVPSPLYGGEYSLC